MTEFILFAWYPIIVGIVMLIRLLYHSIYPTEADQRAIDLYRLKQEPHVQTIFIPPAGDYP